MPERFFMGTERGVDLRHVEEEHRTVKPVPLLGQMDTELLEALTAELHRLLEATLEVADHGQPVPVEDREKMPLVRGQTGVLQGAQSLVQKLLSLAQVAFRQIAGMEHGEKIGEADALARIIDPADGIFLGEAPGPLRHLQGDIRHEELDEDGPEKIDPVRTGGFEKRADVLAIDDGFLVETQSVVELEPMHLPLGN